MEKHQLLLEDLIKASQKNTETLLELYFRTVNEDVSDEEIIKTLAAISKDLVALQANINFQLKSAKKY